MSQIYSTNSTNLSGAFTDNSAKFKRTDFLDATSVALISDRSTSINFFHKNFSYHSYFWNARIEVLPFKEITSALHNVHFIDHFLIERGVNDLSKQNTSEFDDQLSLWFETDQYEHEEMRFFNKHQQYQQLVFVSQSGFIVKIEGNLEADITFDTMDSYD